MSGKVTARSLFITLEDIVYRLYGFELQHFGAKVKHWTQLENSISNKVKKKI